MNFYIKYKGVKVVNIAVKVGFGGIATLILLVAKLAGLFPFSWWWVAAPILIAYAVTFVIITYTALMIGSDLDE